MDKIDECYECVNIRNVPGNTHIRCADPDPEMIGNPHGIKNGWFIYPLLFDPVWKEKDCKNFVSKTKPETNPSVSDAISQVA